MSATLRLVADPTRLRILALLEEQELSVSELCRALDLAQSRVSNHLRLLREADLLAERHEGASTYLRLASPTQQEALFARLWKELRQDVELLPEHSADRTRLDTVLSERTAEDFFERRAAHWDKIAGDFENGQARLRAAMRLLPRESVLADLGCGTGYMAQALLGSCARLHLVDRSKAMLDQARERLSRSAGRTELVFQRAELDSLPLKTASLDGLVAGMVLHHLSELAPVLREMRRVLKPGACAALLELLPHHESWMRAAQGDRHLGLSPTDVIAALEKAGFGDLALDPIQDYYRPPRPNAVRGAKELPRLGLYLVSGRA